MQSVFFTLCSNNYLAQAKTLGDSLKGIHPDAHFIIGLVDKRHPEIDYGFFEPYEILPYNEIDCPFFEDMILTYNVIEFNTSVKPFYFDYLFKRYRKESVVYYLDPDIVVYSGFEPLNQILTQHSLVITPHLTEARVKMSPVEMSVLNTGMFNLGFIGISNSDESHRFLAWWKERLLKHCLIDKARGLFVDQLWVNFAPIMFKRVYTLLEPGYNMAWWNFPERRLLKKEGTYFVNEGSRKLVFFHFSGFKPGNKNTLGRISDKEFSLEVRPDLVEIFNDYEQSLYRNNHATYSKLKPLLSFASDRYSLKQQIGRSLKFRVNALVKKYFGV